MILSIILAAQTGTINNCPVSTPRKAITVGWHDEFSTVRKWQPLAGENKLTISTSEFAGKATLSLGPVPPDWPYQYQWNAMSRDLRVDIARFPVLIARVWDVIGYSHLDIDVLDARDRAVRTFRSNTLTEHGITQIDLGRFLDPASYHLRLRLIVGGATRGCRADYDWVRFVSRADAAYFIANPELGRVKL